MSVSADAQQLILRQHSHQDTSTDHVTCQICKVCVAQRVLHGVCEDYVVQPAGSAGTGVSPQKVLASVCCGNDHFQELGHHINNHWSSDRTGDHLVDGHKPLLLSQVGGHSKEHDTSHATDALLSVLALLQPEVPKFSGDVTQYLVFITVFDVRVVSHTASFADRLYYFDQHLAGELKDIISSCFYIDSQNGYNMVRTLLDKEHGNTYRVSMVYLSQINKWPVVKQDDS